MTQDEIVQKTIAGSEKSIKEVAAETGILQPAGRPGELCRSLY